MNCLIFDIEADFGLFKRYDSTASPTCYSSIPKPTLVGLVSSIIGEFDGDDGYLNFLDYFNDDNCKIGIELLSPIKKTMIGFNFQNIKDQKAFNKKNVQNAFKKNNEETLHLYSDFLLNSGAYKDKKAEHTQTNVEILVKPAYRIYFTHKNKTIYDTLKDRVVNDETYYPPFMGTSDFPATISFIDEVVIEPEEIDKETPINSVMPKKHANYYIQYASSGQTIIRHTRAYEEKQHGLFVKSGNDRKCSTYTDLVIPDANSEIIITDGICYKINEKNVILY